MQPVAPLSLHTPCFLGIDSAKTIGAKKEREGVFLGGGGWGRLGTTITDRFGFHCEFGIQESVRTKHSNRNKMSAALKLKHYPCAECVSRVKLPS